MGLEDIFTIVLGSCLIIVILVVIIIYEIRVNKLIKEYQKDILRLTSMSPNYNKFKLNETVICIDKTSSYFYKKVGKVIYINRSAKVDPFYIKFEGEPVWGNELQIKSINDLKFKKWISK